VIAVAWVLEGRHDAVAPQAATANSVAIDDLTARPRPRRKPKPAAGYGSRRCRANRSGREILAGLRAEFAGLRAELAELRAQSENSGAINDVKSAPRQPRRRSTCLIINERNAGIDTHRARPERGDRPGGAKRRTSAAASRRGGRLARRAGSDRRSLCRGAVGGEVARGNADA